MSVDKRKTLKLSKDIKLNIDNILKSNDVLTKNIVDNVKDTDGIKNIFKKNISIDMSTNKKIKNFDKKEKNLLKTTETNDLKSEKVYIDNNQKPKIDIYKILSEAYLKTKSNENPVKEDNNKVLNEDIKKNDLNNKDIRINNVSFCDNKYNNVNKTNDLKEFND